MSPISAMKGSQLNCGRLIFELPFLTGWPSSHQHGDNYCHVLQNQKLHTGLVLGRGTLAQKNKYVEYLHTYLASEFWGGAPKQEQGMRRLFRGMQQIVKNVIFGEILSILDVGTAQYEGPDRCHAADLAVILGCSAVSLHAFDPLESELQRTRRAAQQQLRRDLRIKRRAAEQCITWHHMAASNMTGVVTMRGKANQASLSMAIPDGTMSPDYRRHEADPVIRVKAKRLDEFAAETTLGPVLLLKIDTEGHDMEVLQGTRGLLERGCIAAIVFEIAGQMNADFFRIHKEFGQPRPDIAAQLGNQTAQPNLRSMVQWLEVLDYDSFLIGGRSLIPLTSSWWHNSYEVCITRAELPCWYDVLAICRSRSSCFGTSLVHIQQFLLDAFQEI